MPGQLLADCLNEIFEYLEEDKITLHSCLLVNRLWCEVAVRILWRNIWRFQYNVQYNPYPTHVPLSIIGTLIACLPDESKKLLLKNGISISSPTFKPPIFNYVSLCKALSIYSLDKMIQNVLEKKPSTTIPSRSLSYNKYLLTQEILKMFINEISSLKSLDYCSGRTKDVENIMFTCLPGTKNCLKDLTELNCSSDIYSEFYYQLSQICHNIQILTIEFGDIISNGLTDLISLQNNLKSVTLKSEDKDGTEVIASSLTKFSSTLTKLIIKEYYIPLSFIAMFINLQELILSFDFKDGLDDFVQLQYVTFPYLKVLKFLDECPKAEMLMKFLELNGKNLKELYVGNNNNSLNLSISRFCPNLEKLSTVFMDSEIETLKIILNNCKHLKGINVWCGDEYLNEKKLLQIIAKYSPKNFRELEMYYIYDVQLEVLPEELEEFFTNWKNRQPQQSLSIIIIKNYDDCISLEVNRDNMKIIEKYLEIGLVKKFKTKIMHCYDDDYNFNK
ncbi:uncharacterized protein OCT59_010481 [Rhizophagus irregularis]|uniref:F-box domain-containing protein n=3 Tax=Rhizophagus irregularis TaxID=588596 RepID=A0A015K135_RHIIW|nr:hypothetical protein RirG_041380 [Rhizophagus irregularis DAOM 197198w]UZO19182.1 hypothetical protein OCT59_010481 [Rhizophagus irregularis]GET61424.1 hypothetical protein GLOIN_2v1591804 [Rhizophagus irregularis DAOM 181602=DAOM 197198]